MTLARRSTSRVDDEALTGFAAAREDRANDEGSAPRASFGRAVLRSLPWVVCLIVLGAAIGVLIGLAQPNRYVSTAKLTLRMGAREQLTSESLLDFDERPHATTPTMFDELAMLSDVAIFERVAKTLGPDMVLAPADPERDDGPSTAFPIRAMHALQAWISRNRTASSESPEKTLRAATRSLFENTTVVNEPGSSVILVSTTSSSSTLARSIVDALSAAFIARHREQFSIETLLAKTRTEAADVKRARDETAAASVAQISTGRIAELETQVPRVELEVASLEGDVFEAGVRREEIARQREALSGRLKGIPSEVEIRRPRVMIPNEEYETQLSLKRSLLAQKGELSIQNRPSEETRRRDKEFDNQLAKVDEKLAALPKTIAQGSEMEANASHAAMEAQIINLEVEDEGLSVKQGLLSTRLDAKRGEATELEKRLLTANSLRKDLTTSRDAEQTRYSRVLSRLSSLESLENIDASEGANLRVLQAPTLELESVGPKRAKLLFEGLFAGIFAATAFAILRQRFERRLRYPESFELARGVPVLAVVPRLASLSRTRSHASVGGP